jgi:hypothetical protein
MPARTDALGRLAPMTAIQILPLLAASLFLTGCFSGARSYLPRGKIDIPPLFPKPPGRAETEPLRITPPPPPDSLTLSVADTSDESSMALLAKKAVENEKKLNNYICRMRRREVSNGQDRPEEIIQFRYRRAPLSVHMKWLGSECKGREIIYVQGQHDNKLHLLTGVGDLFGPGKHMTFAPDSSLIRAKSHYLVTEAGIGAAVTRFSNLMDAVARKQTNLGSAKYLGKQTRAEFPKPMEAIEQTLPPGLEPYLPKGGTRDYYFDENLGLPTLIVTFDTNHHEVEYYCFDRLQAPVDLDDADFDPTSLWGK